MLSRGRQGDYGINGKDGTNRNSSGNFPSVP
jgi:hypothetical protein